MSTICTDFIAIRYIQWQGHVGSLVLYVSIECDIASNSQVMVKVQCFISVF